MRSVVLLQDDIGFPIIVYILFRLQTLSAPVPSYTNSLRCTTVGSIKVSRYRSYPFYSKWVVDFRSPSFFHTNHFWRTHKKDVSNNEKLQHMVNNYVILYTLFSHDLLKTQNFYNLYYIGSTILEV